MGELGTKRTTRSYQNFCFGFAKLALVLDTQPYWQYTLQQVYCHLQ